MPTCFSPSILLSACWTASRYLKCNSISRSTWGEWNGQTKTEGVRDAAHNKEAAEEKLEDIWLEMERKHRDQTGADSQGKHWKAIFIFYTLIIHWFYCFINQERFVKQKLNKDKKHSTLSLNEFYYPELILKKAEKEKQSHLHFDVYDKNHYGSLGRRTQLKCQILYY